MSNPIDSAAKGLAQSQAQLASSAKRLVQSAATRQTFSSDVAAKASAAPAFAKTDQQQDGARRPASSSPSSARYSGTPLQGQGAYIPSMAEETVQMRMAANAYKTNARMMQAADDILKMTQEALSSGNEAGEDRDQ